MATKVTDPYTDLHDDESGKMTMAAKYGGWDTVWQILNRKPYLVNCIPEERAWAILHQAVWWKDVIAVKKILAVPGCDSELLTKNGLRPLDIETTAEIRKLLEQHIAQANGWEIITQGDLVGTNKKETPQGDLAKTNEKGTLFSNNEVSKKITSEATYPKITIPKENKQTYEELVKKDEQHTKAIGEEAKNKNWDKLFSLLDKWKNLVNKTDPDTGMAPLHYAAEANDVEAVQKILYYPACDPAVKTAKESSYGAEQTAAMITTSDEVKAAIRWKEKKLQEEHTSEPTYVSIHDSNLILMRYTAQAMEEYKGNICDDDLNLEYLRVFPEMGLFIFDFINLGDARMSAELKVFPFVPNNWKKAKSVVLTEIHKFDATLSERLAKITKIDSFCKELIRWYTADFIYKKLNKELRNQSINKPNTKTEFKAYSALTNAILLQNVLKQPVYTQKTFRRMNLKVSDIKKYSKGKEFAWLSFTSSSSKKKESFYENCMFVIDNSQSCVWSPRGISSFSEYQAELEYLYPCGAQFRVTKVEKVNGKTQIHMELICKTEPRQLLSIIASNFEIQAEGIKAAIATLIKKRKEFENRKGKLSAEIKKYQNYENVDEMRIVEVHSKTEAKLMETKHFELETAIQNVITKLGEWEVKTQRFDEKLALEQEKVRVSSKKLLNLYSKKKIQVKNAKSQLENGNLICL